MRYRLLVLLIAVLGPGAAPAVALEPWDGANPFTCTLQNAGFGTTVPDPAADPFCVRYEKTRQNVTELGLVEFLAQEPARIALAVPKCRYFQSDHWRASVVQDDGTTELWEWEGRYFFDRTTGNGGGHVRAFTINGQPAEAPFTGGLRTTNAVALDPSCGGITIDAGVVRVRIRIGP